MDFNVTREQWIDRFVIRISALSAGSGPDDFAALAMRLWPERGHLPPEEAAETAAAHDAEVRFERTERIPVERLQAEGAYVRDDDEWIARCTARVLELDPIIKADEARRSVTDLAGLERWRLMKPEAAADQLYTPIKLRPSDPA